MKAEKDIRQVYRAGQSVVVTLPPNFVDQHDLEPSDLVELVYGDDFLKLIPISQEDIEKELEESSKIK